MTAVEWLTDKFYANEGIMKSEWLEKAKEIEKELITDGYNEGKINGIDISHPLSLTKEISAELYYNETFKSE